MKNKEYIMIGISLVLIVGAKITLASSGSIDNSRTPAIDAITIASQQVIKEAYDLQVEYCVDNEANGQEPFDECKRSLNKCFTETMNESQGDTEWFDDMLSACMKASV